MPFLLIVLSVLLVGCPNTYKETEQNSPAASEHHQDSDSTAAANALTSEFFEATLLDWLLSIYDRAVGEDDTVCQAISNKWGEIVSKYGGWERSGVEGLYKIFFL